MYPVPVCGVHVTAALGQKLHVTDGRSHATNDDDDDDARLVSR